MMVAAQRRPGFEEEETGKPRNRRTYKKHEKDNPFGRKDKDEPRSKKRSAGGEDALDDDYDDDFEGADDDDDDDLDPDDFDFDEDVDEDDDFDDDWSDDDDN
ncbi:hypothetical protein KJ682_09525 [bacterium]|nr:hypothetical protein [bacterium]